MPAPRNGESAANLQVSRGAPIAAPDPYDFPVPAVRPAHFAGNGGAGSCAAFPCTERLSPQTGRGRRRRYCSAKCRKRAANRAPVPRPVAPRQSVGAFGRRLRAAIEDSELKLATISRRLNLEDGVTVTPSTISNWQNGCLPRRGPEADKRVFALERVLGLRSSELLLLLGTQQRAATVPPVVRERSRPHDDIDGFRAAIDRRGGTSGYVTTAVSDTVVIGVNRRENVRRVRQTIRAIEANRVDCCWGFYSTDSIGSVADVKVHSGCRLGRFVVEGGMLAVELLFDRVLPLGGSHTFEFSVYPHGAPESLVRRGTGTTALEALDMTVRFDVEPNAVWLADWPTRNGEPRRRKACLTDGAVHLSHRHPVPGYYGVVWAW